MGKQILMIGLVLALVLCVTPVFATVCTPGYDSVIYPGDTISCDENRGLFFTPGADCAIFELNDIGFPGGAYNTYTYKKSDDHGQPYLVFFSWIAGCGGNTVKWRWKLNTTVDTRVNVTFSVSETGNFTKKLSGVLVTLSNGQSNTTDANGNTMIRVNPSSALYNYVADKSGYWSNFGSLGGYGVTGGIKYITMDLATGTLPTGYTRTTVYATDGITGGYIVGATLNLRDVQNNTWVNTTSTAYGINIDVITGHTLDIYGSYPGVYTSSYELGAVAGGNYYLPLMPPVPTPPGGYGGGQTNLFVNVFDGNGNMTISHATIMVKLPTGGTIAGDSGDWGTVMFLVPNNTVIILSTSKLGYGSISQSFNSGPALEKIVKVRLSRTTITPTPTVTDPLTGDPITPVPTLDIRTDAQKDLDLLNMLRSNSETIMGLAILAVIFGLLKLIMKF